MTMTGRESSQSGDAAYDDFVLAYGQAIFAWQDVETDLFKFYHALRVQLGKNDIMEASRLFYEKRPSFGPKLRLVSQVAGEARIESIIQWTALKADLCQKSQDRNALAHCPPCRRPQRNGLDVWELCPPPFAPLKAVDISSLGKRYDAAGLRRLSGDFGLLAQRIADAMRAVNGRLRRGSLDEAREQFRGSFKGPEA